MDPLAAWPASAAFALTLGVYDLGAWIAHRAMHRFDFLWSAHKVHHASPRLDWLAAFRMHPLEHALRHALSPVLLLIAGFPVLYVALASILAAAWAAFVHANLDLGWARVEGWLVTPRLHHLHHVPATHDRNFGAIFSLWDRLAGRLTREPAAKDAALGVPGELATFPHTFWPQLAAPFVSREAAPRSAPAPAAARSRR